MFFLKRKYTFILWYAKYYTMAKDSKNTGRSSAKSGQYHVGRKSDSKMVAAKSSSKFYSSNESRGFSSKKDSLHASFVVGISPKGNYHGTTIIAETTDRPDNISGLGHDERKSELYF